MTRAEDDRSELLNELASLRQRVAELEAQQAEWQHTAAALQASEENLRTLIDATPDFICFKDGQGRWLEANEFAVRLFELADVDWRGKTDVELAEFSPSYRSAFLYCAQTDEQAWQAGGSRAEEVIPNPAGPAWVFDVIKVPTFEANGQRKGLVVVGRDISERKRVEERLRFLAQLLDSVRESVVATDLEGRVIYWGNGAEQLYGYRAEEVMGRLITFIVPPEEEAAEQERIRQVIETGQWRGQYLQRRQDGSLFWADTAISLVTDEQGQPAGLIGIDFDITERREMEQALRKRSRELELLNRSSQAFIASLELDQVLTTVLEEVRQALEVVACSIWLLDPASGELVCRQASGPQREHVQGWRLKPGQGLVGWAVQHNQSLNVPDIRADQRHFRGVDQQTGLALRSILTVPLPGKAGPIGGLQLVDEAVGRFNGSDVRLCELLAAAAAGAIEHARLFESLKTSQEYAQGIIDSSMDMIITVDLQRRVVEFNRAAEQAFGYQRAEVVGQAVDLLYADPDKARSIHRLTVEQGQIVQEVLNRRQNGERFPSLLAASALRRADGEITGVMGISRDITSQKQAEAELERRNRELDLLNRVLVASAKGTAPAAILDLVCRELARLFDLPQAAAVLLNEAGTAATVVAEYRIDERSVILNELLPVGKDDPSADFLVNLRTPLVIGDAPNDPRLALLRPLLRQSGTVSMMILPLLVEEEAVGGLSLSATTQRAFATAEVELAWRVIHQVAGALTRARLIENQRRLSAAVEQTDDSVVISDAEGMIIYVNPAYERTSGYDRAEVIGRQARQFKREQNGNADETLLDEICETLRVGRAWRGRLVSRRKSSEPYTDEATITPVRDEAGQVAAYVSVQRDVTRELELEAQLRQAQKMEAVGQLAGGIAHDFNNILTAIMGYVGLSQTQLPADHPVYQDLAGIHKSAQRAAALVRRLLTFARRQVGQMQILDLNDLVLDQAPLLRRLLREDIELVTLPAPEPAPVKADPHQLEQVLLNLAVNAHDAMPEGGKLTITTATVALAKAEAGRYELEPGRYVRLVVSDTGVGISAEDQARIFEPFFTTKNVGEGTGLGLAICFEIIKQHQGSIQVETAPGQGTTFEIYLPQAGEIAVSAPPPTARQVAPPGRETILLVEDEPAVRDLAIRTLQEQGYTILVASNGEEALRLVETQSERTIELLLTDVVMPLLGGRELARRLRASQPDLKVLFTSGYVVDEDFRDKLRETGANFLPKPFTPAELAGRVRRTLDA